MPTVLRIGPYRFHFYSREGNEPPHIHVQAGEDEAKAPNPGVSLGLLDMYVDVPILALMPPCG